MSGALKAGGVYVAVSAAIGEFTKTMGDVVKSVAQTAARVKAAAAPLAEVGRLFAAGMAGAVLASAASNGRIAKDVERLKAQLYTLAADIGDAFGPFVRQLTHAVSSLVGTFQRLSPATKESLAKFVIFMASMGAGATVLGKAAGLVEGVAKMASGVLVPALGAASSAAKLLGEAGGAAFPALGQAVAGMEGGVLQSIAKMVVGFGTVLIPIAEVAAAVAGVVLLAGALYEAWSDSSAGLKDSLASVWESVKDLGGKLLETLQGWWETLKGVLVTSLRFLLDLVAKQVSSIAKVLGPVARGLGLEKIAGTFEDLQSLTGDKLLEGLQSGATFLADKATSAAKTLAHGAVQVGKDVAEGVSYGLSTSLKGVKRIASDIGLDKLPEKLKGVLGGLLGGPAGKTRTPRNKAAEEKQKAFAKDMAELQRKEQEDAHEEFIKSVRAEEAAGADAFKQMAEEAARVAEEAKKAAEAAAEKVRAAKVALVQKFTGAFGDIADLVSSFQEGLVAGGPSMGLAAVLGDLLTRSTQFQHLVEVLNGIVGMVADTVGQLAEPFIPLVGALSMLVRAGLDALAPLFSMLGALIQPLVPPLVVLGELFQALAPIIGLLVAMMTLILNPLQLFAGPVMHALFDMLKLVSRVILTVAKAVAGVWNGIVGAIQSVLRTIGNFSIFGKRPLGFLSDWADGLDSARINTDALAASLQALSGMTWEQAQAAAQQTAETVRNRKELQKANEELSNVPNAFKIALRRFESQDAQTTFTGAGETGIPVATTPMPGPQTGLPAGAPQYSGNGGDYGNIVNAYGAASGQAGPTFNITTTIHSTNPVEAMSQYEKTVDKVAYKLTGSRGRAGRWAVAKGE